MSDEQACGRPIPPAPAGVDAEPVCVMHTKNPNRNAEKFALELKAILGGISQNNRPTDSFDFTGFVFFETKFSKETFLRNAIFSGATFTQDTSFRGATFSHDASFDGATFIQDASFYDATFTQVASFGGAKFNQNASFEGATFTREASFRGATFTQDASFAVATFTQNASFYGATITQELDFSQATIFGSLDFRSLTVLSQAHVLLHRVNEAGDAPGLRMRFGNCLLDRFRFEDVNWHRKGGRLVLQDELDLRKGAGGITHEVVAGLYRRLVNNFEKQRQYDLAEDCVIGEMEMRRLDPERFAFTAWSGVGGNWFWPRWRRRVGKRAAKAYKEQRWARWMGEHLSVANLYRLLSNYGSSYRRATGALFVLLLSCALLFPLAGLRPAKGSDLKPLCPGAIPGSPEASVISWRCALEHQNVSAQVWGTLKTGLWAALETATFQRDKLFEPANNWGRALAILESIAIPGQAALFFLALRRRFRR